VDLTDDHSEILGRAEQIAEQARRAEDELADRREELAAVIRRARELDPPVPISALADATGLTEARVSQIAHGRR
jgi:predicted transcriptional regulator